MPRLNHQSGAIDSGLIHDPMALVPRPEDCDEFFECVLCGYIVPVPGWLFDWISRRAARFYGRMRHHADVRGLAPVCTWCAHLDYVERKRKRLIEEHKRQPEPPPEPPKPGTIMPMFAFTTPIRKPSR